jgi:glycosyltransferase A (GT-A) superfamily protein (DUF2064 family)
MSERPDRVRALRNAARKLLSIRHDCPELFEHVLPINDEDLLTLEEIADERFDDDDEYE